MTIQGIPGTPGVVEGVIRMYNGQDSGSFDSDDIVAIDRTFDPKLAQDLSHVAAVLLRTGGRTSHGVVIAGELDLTTVCGLENKFDELEPGQRAVVDGLEGTVELEGEK